VTNYFFDLDGVFADIWGGYEARFGHPLKGADSKIKWQNMMEDETFYETLPVLDGSAAFLWKVENVLDVTPVILTASPRSKYEHVAQQKLRWVKKNLGDYLVIPTYGAETKYLWAGKNKLLLDDHKKNTCAWEEAGGTAVHHTSFDNSYRELVKLGRPEEWRQQHA
jgi:hypothetical protein